MHDPVPWPLLFVARLATRRPNGGRMTSHHIASSDLPYGSGRK